MSQTEPTPEQRRAKLDADIARRQALEQKPAAAKAATDPADPEGIQAAFARAGLRMLSATEVAVIEREQSEAVAEQQRQQSREGRVRLWAKICPDRYCEPFAWEKVAAEADHAALAQVLAWKYSDRGMYIVGETGASKSRAVGNALGRVFVDQGRSVRHMDGIEFANSAGAAFGDASKAEAWLRELCKPDVLWIDDFAKRWTPATEEAAFALVERRTARHNRPLIITNNYGKEGMEAMAHDILVMGPMIRRLKDYCDVISV